MSCPRQPLQEKGKPRLGLSRASEAVLYKVCTATSQVMKSVQCTSLTLHHKPCVRLCLANVAGVHVTVCLFQGIDDEPQGHALLAGYMLP